jgi:DNA-binding MarR family transcriptional regulator
MATPTEKLPLKPRVKPPYELVCSTSYLLKRLGWAVKDRTVEVFEASGESPYHFAVLAVLDESPRETQATIADSLGYDSSWLVRLLDELEQGGLIERKRDPADRRRHLVSLNPAGKQKLDELRAISRGIDDEFLAGLDADARKELHELLLQVARHHDPRYSS